MGFIAWIFAALLVYLVLFAFPPTVRSNPINPLQAQQTDPPWGLVRQVEIDGCEYLLWLYTEPNGRFTVGGITHKANCKNHSDLKLPPEPKNMLNRQIL